MNRLGICVFFDSEGIVDNYICYFLEQLMPFLNELLVVVNGKITEDSKLKLNKFTPNIQIRENTGLDAYAYKYGLENIGWNKLKEYDEVLLFNTTCFAPIYPFNEMFEKIDKKECDFWGLYHWKAPENSGWVKGYHIPSFFFAYRNSLLKSNVLKEYYDTMPNIQTYKDAVLYHEQRQTPFFIKNGFKYAVCFDLDKYATDTEYWPQTKETDICKFEKFPFLKRRSLFFINNKINLQRCEKIINFLRNTQYDINLIIENIERTQKNNNFKFIRKKILCLYKIFIYSLLFSREKILKYKKNYRETILKRRYINLLKSKD